MEAVLTAGSIALSAYIKKKKKKNLLFPNLPFWVVPPPRFRFILTPDGKEKNVQG